MASGDVHEKYLRLGWILIIPIGIAWYFISGWNYFYPLFLYFNFFLCDAYSDPDLDHGMITRSEYDIKRLTKNISLAIVPPFLFLPKKSKFKKFLKRINLGILGAFMVAWSQVYEYIASEAGGHRSWFGHGFIISTIGRIIWFNIPLVVIANYIINYSIAYYGTPPFDFQELNYLFMHLWLHSYLSTQAVAWFIGDTIHLYLDTNKVKGVLYGFEKFGDKRKNNIIRNITNRILNNGKKKEGSGRKKK